MRVGAIAGLAFLQFASLSLPRAAYGDPPEASASYFTCAPTSAAWTSGAAEDGIEGPQPEPNRWSGVKACKTGGHELLVRAQEWFPPSFHCSAYEEARVSAWVDGRRIVSNEEAGPYWGCLDTDVHPVLNAVHLTADGMVKICHAEESGDAAPAKNRACRAISAAEILHAPKDKLYHHANHRTPPGFTVRFGEAGFCQPLTRNLRLVPTLKDTDQSLAAFTLRAAEGWADAADPTSTGGEPRHARFDIDNDGRLNRVSLDLTFRLHGTFLTKLTWSSGRPGGEPYQAADLPDKVPKSSLLKGQSNYWAYVFRPVRIRGRNYVYERRLTFGDWSPHDWDAERGASPDGDHDVTRGLLELHPDGSTTLRCGWGPRLRREEFLSEKGQHL